MALRAPAIRRDDGGERDGSRSVPSRGREGIVYTPRAGEREGIVYTPREVCEPMVRVALAPLIADRVAVLDKRIIDPCVGEGAFLVELVRVLAESLGGHGGAQRAARRRVAEQCIYGLDVDSIAVQRSIAAVEDFVSARVPGLREHIVVGDALDPTPRRAWPERFDALVANPPYVRQELLANKSALRSFEAYDGVADLYIYFVELAHRIARRFCLVVPNKWMTAAYGRPLRQFLARRGSLEGLVDFSAGLFDDADSFPCIVWGTSDGATEPLRAGRAEPPVAEALASTPVIERARWNGGDEPWHTATGDDAALLERLARTLPPLSAIVPERPSRGVVTGCNRAFVIDAATRERILDAEPAAAELVRPFIKGRDVKPWSSAPIDRYILLVDRGTSLVELPRVRDHLEQFRTALEPRPREHTGVWHGRKPGAYRWCELQDPVVPLAKSRRPRLFYQDIQTAPACCLDPSGELVPDTTVWILPTDDRFLLALLNSPLYAWYARQRFPPALNGAVRPKLEYMRALPIAQPTKALRGKIDRLVDVQLRDPAAVRGGEIAELVNDAYGLSVSERALLRER
ncbi:MAG TPA: N-6 DNA methylase [Kofleriaceae bacterium]|nr:N-6 DNA methylase [Kofleriaceae bacterium]